MHSTFQLSLRTKSSEQLLNMVSNQSSWSEDQFNLILDELNNRGISTLEVEELNSKLKEQNNEEELQSEFEKDLAIISEAEEKEVKRDRFQLVALVLGLSLTVLMGFTLFDGFGLLKIENNYTDAYLFVFIEYLIVIIVWFFAIWGFFIGKKYLLSIITSAGLELFIFVMSWINS